ncbi:MAG: hypothetical protein HYX69_16415 [Planctomycetia bacterium]|nr:hypothetical protein [Planctomycetia bacterium]
MVQFFRSGQTDDRRRRVLTEEVVGTVTASAKMSAARRAETRAYAKAALREQQPAVVDLVPQKVVKVLLAFVLAVSVVAGLEVLYAAESLKFGGQRLPALDLAAEGSLGNWLTSLALFAAGVVALVVYSLRRHRLDDYHGRYRVWLWAAACWFLLAIDEGASLHESLQAACAQFTAQTLADGEILWIGIYGLLIGGVGLRLLFEMRDCRLSTAVLVAAAAAFAVALAAHLARLPAVEGEHRVMVEEGCEMAGSLLLLLSMCLHVRYVNMDAQGLLAARPRKESTSKGRRSLWGRKAAVDPPHASVRPSAKRSDLSSVESDDEEDDEDESSAEDDEQDAEESARNAHDIHRLSKAERKALRRQQRRARLG